MKIEIDDAEIKEEVKKYIMRKIKKELKEEIDEQILDICTDVETFELRTPEINKKLEKIEDWINDNFLDKRLML